MKRLNRNPYHGGTETQIGQDIELDRDKNVFCNPFFID